MPLGAQPSGCTRATAFRPREWLLQGASLGRQVAALLDPETPVPCVTTGDPRPELRTIDFDGGTEDLALKARWGYRGKGGVVMPGNGKTIERGDGTLDVVLNDGARWIGIPRPVWEYTLGGYQVLKKWLSYREEAVLGRPLTIEEVREFRNIARRIAALLALGFELDAHYRFATTEAPN